MIRGILFALAAAFILVSCAPQNLVVLIPDPDGHVGKVDVSNAAGTSTIDTAKTVVSVASATSKPDAPQPITDAKIQDIWGGTLSSMPPRPLTYNLYFENGGTTLTADSQAQLPQILDKAKGWPFPHIVVAGHSDTVGAHDANVTLSKQRADIVRDALVQAGISPQGIESTGYGDTDQLVSTAPNVAEPRNRRVLVTIQ